MKVNVIDLENIQRKNDESLNDYVSIFRLMKVRCMTMIPKHELVQMDVACLNYTIGKKIASQLFQDMFQLVETSRKIEKLNLVKEKFKNMSVILEKTKVII